MQKANKSYTCDKCGEEILKGSLYNYHQTTTNGKVARRHYCLKCEGKRTNTNWYDYMEILAFEHITNKEKALIISNRTGKTITNKDIARTKHRYGVR